MTTAKSPEHILREQAHNIAKHLKDIAEGKNLPPDPAGKIAAAKAKGEFEVGICMDDKIIKVKIGWQTMVDLALPLLCDFIYDEMRKDPDAPDGQSRRSAH